MNISKGVALIMGAKLPPAITKPPNTQMNRTTKPIIADI
jgi:hypothetical protein